MLDCVVDIEYELRGIRFRWNADKARRNAEKHGVSFEQAAQVFFDPFLQLVDASVCEEARDAAIGADFEFRILFVVHLLIEDDYLRLVSARKVDASERARYENADD